MKRPATAAVLGILLWAVIKLAPPWAFFAIGAVFVLLGAGECYGMLDGLGTRPFKVLGLASVLAVYWTFTGVAPVYSAVIPILGATALATIASMWNRPDPQAMLGASWSTLFPVIFVGLGLAYMAGLRAVPGELGEDLTLLAFVCVTFSDTAAYYVGSRLGRHRMAPNLSPKKSWEGALGGMIASVGGALLAHVWFYQRLAPFHAVAIGALLGAAGILGDLSESMWKRASGVKDSSRLLPGHGGVLDRVDGLLFAGPVLYYYYRIFLESRP